MKLHELKIKDCYYSFVEMGFKTFELRKNDRDFQRWDTIHFVDVKGQDFLINPNNVYIITYVLKNCEEYGLDKDYCILGIKKMVEQHTIEEKEGKNV